jgi:hypothetical protein
MIGVSVLLHAHADKQMIKPFVLICHGNDRRNGLSSKGFDGSVKSPKGKNPLSRRKAGFPFKECIGFFTDRQSHQFPHPDRHKFRLMQR